MAPVHRIAGRHGIRGSARRLIAAMAAAVLAGVPALAQKISISPPVDEAAGAEIVTSGGEPELRVGGVPFFLHAAQFDYFRIPRDLWAHSLLRYRDLGINTIDLRIPWNWHEPQDGKFDFDGHTNPKRDLRALLDLIAQMRFKLIVRPGPVVRDQWPNAGIPSWMLTRSGDTASAAGIQDGATPQDALLTDRDSNATARAWLANELHMTFARRWLTAVAKVLAPYSARKMVSITDPDTPGGKGEEKLIPGPLLLVALDDATSVSAGAESADFVRYLGELRAALDRGGLEAIPFLNIPGAAAQGLAPLADASAPQDASPIGFASQWIFDPGKMPQMANNVSVDPADALPDSLLTAVDASSLAFLARTLATQSKFPPFLSAFSPTTFAPSGDTRAAQPATENTLLASRLLLGSGIRGIVYAPLQDTLTPAGWETPSAARYFRWDAALDLDANREPRARGVERNGEFISAWGAMLAASHLQSDIGIVDLRASAMKTGQASNARYAEETEQLCRIAALAGYAPELVNPDAQSAERLLRDRVILLDVPQDAASSFQLSKQAQQALVEFVRRGGALAYFPARPLGSGLDPLWQGAPANPAAGDGLNEWTIERGRVIASSADIFARAHQSQDLSEDHAEAEVPAAAKVLATLLEQSGAHRALRIAKDGGADSNLIVSELVANTAAAGAARPLRCAETQLCAAALISATNLNPDQPVEQSLEINEPGGAGAPSQRAVSLDVTVPAHDSLLLPVHAPLCSAAPPGENCSDEVIAAGAELLGAQREGKTLELSFYTPVRESIRLHLENEPSKVEFDEDYRADSDWKQETGELDVQLPRGSSPDYIRVLRIHLRYTPHVLEKPNPGKDDLRGMEYEVYNALRFPLGPDVTIPTGPPLLLADPATGGRLVISTQNLSDEVRTSDFNLDGAFHGTGFARTFGEEQQTTSIRIQPSRSSPDGNTPPPAPDGLLSGQLSVRSGRQRGGGSVLFLPEKEEGNAHYKFDFDRDGSPEWVLESSRLRLIVSPAYSGRALALVDKSTNDDLITFGGALHDFLIAPGARPQDASVREDFAFNRGYEARWMEEKPDASLRLTYSSPEKSSAGLRVEKTLHFIKPETIEASYRISIAAAPAQAVSNSGAPQSFLSELSIPVVAGEDGTTTFCWQPAPISARANPQSSTNASAPSHCENFIPGGAPISVPQGVARLEIRSTGMHSLAVEWTSGRAIIVPQKFSAQIRFVVSVPREPAPPGEFTLRYTAGDGP